MQRLEADGQRLADNPPSGLRAAHAVARDRGVSDVTIWRWGQKGWIKIHNLCGRAYVDLMSLSEFDARVAAGEFSRLFGAARQSAEKRKAKEEINPPADQRTEQTTA